MQWRMVGRSPHHHSSEEYLGAVTSQITNFLSSIMKLNMLYEIFSALALFFNLREWNLVEGYFQNFLLYQIPYNLKGCAEAINCENRCRIYLN